jgi:catechol 2,3-dioxygenase-like lactoylglutathione lyase family enzyme
VPAELIHHIELWVADLASAERQWGPVLLALGCEPYQHWERGRSWRRGGSYVVIEQSDALLAEPAYDRMRAGLNHLAVRGDDTAVAVARAAGWTERIATEDAVHLINADGFELEIRRD